MRNKPVTPQEKMPGRVPQSRVNGGYRRNDFSIQPRHLSVTSLLIIAIWCVSAIPAMAGTPTVMIANYTVSPAVMMPGDTGTLSFTLKSTDQSAQEQASSGVATGVGFASTTSTAIPVYIRNIHVEGNGITILTADFDRVGDLGPGQTLPITVLIRAPEKEGMYFPELWIDTGTGIGDGTSTRYPVPVNVNTRISLQKKPDLSLMKTTPGSVDPGNDFNAAIQLRNDGVGRADDIFLALNTTFTSVSLKSPANYHLDHLDPGENITFNLAFSSDKEATLGLTSVPVTIDYANADGARNTLMEHIGIPIRGKAKIAIKSLTMDPVRPKPGEAVTLTLRIENTGTDRATSVKAVLTTPLSGTKESFIGSIDKDSDGPAIFYVKPVQSGEIPVSVNLTYDDDYGSHTLTENATITVSESNTMIVAAAGLIIAAAIAGAAFWFLRIRKKEDA